MRIVFFGASQLGYECCKAIIEAGHTVTGIFTIPETFSIKYKEESERKKVKNVLFRDFRDFEKLYSIPVIEAEGNLSRYQEELKKFNPDFILVIGWYYLIPGSMLAMAPKGAAGIHGSLLPKYRGNAPFVWAMINGEAETGISLFYFDDGIDTGDIIAQQSIPIDEQDTIKDILDKAQAASIKVLLENLSKIASGTASRWQQQHEKATYFPKRTPDDGLIDWTWDSRRIRNFIRAQTKPYPGAYTIINGKKVIIWDADITTDEQRG
ncbi:MAG: methionyl-tRNA formyltransferase [Ferruginibacter sp.]|nr:methionyl-tRNA formyltransferase [Ferruginibacter sp.]